jgi:hypothetical protein
MEEAAVVAVVAVVVEAEDTAPLAVEEGMAASAAAPVVALVSVAPMVLR